MRILLPLIALLACASLVHADPVSSRSADQMDLDGGAGFSFLQYSGQQPRKGLLPFASLQLGERSNAGLMDWLRANRNAKSAEQPKRLVLRDSAPTDEPRILGEETSSVSRSGSGWDFVFFSSESSGDEVGDPQASRGTDLTRPFKKPMRAGLNMRRDNLSAFYGFGWMGEDLDFDTEENLVGSLHLQLRF